MELFLNQEKVIWLLWAVLGGFLLWAFIWCFKEFFGARMKKTVPKVGKAGYRLFYTDQKEENKKAGVLYSKILYAPKWDIQGKPDYIFKKVIGKDLLPVEIKSGRIGESPLPHEGDLMQLAAYFIIIEEVYGVKVKYGHLVYQDAMFVVKNTYGLRKQLKTILIRMRGMLKGKKEPVSPSFVTCRYCVCKGTVCEYCGEGQK